jgi:hypothetical protein
LALLAEFPALLAGDQIDSANPRRFLLIDREQPIACEPGGSARWAHLFIDQDGVPTLVEVKRGDDTRIRREVVGQLLEYGANAILHWPALRLRSVSLLVAPKAAQSLTTRSVTTSVPISIPRPSGRRSRLTSKPAGYA